VWLVQDKSVCVSYSWLGEESDISFVVVFFGLSVLKSGGGEGGGGDVFGGE